MWGEIQKKTSAAENRQKNAIKVQKRQIHCPVFTPFLSQGTFSFLTKSQGTQEIKSVKRKKVKLLSVLMSSPSQSQMPFIVISEAHKAGGYGYFS